MKQKVVRTRGILVCMMFLYIFFLGCSSPVQLPGTQKNINNKKPLNEDSLTLQKEKPGENSISEDVDKVVYLKKIYEKDGKIFLDFHDMREYGNKVTSLPIAKDVKVFLPNYYPEDLFYKLQKDLKDPNNKNIKGILYYLTIAEGEVQTIKRPIIKEPLNVVVEFKKEQDSVLEGTVEAYLNDRIDTMTKGSLADPSQSKFYKNFSPYIVLGRNIDGSIIDYYIWLQQRQFEFQNGVVVDGMGGSIPAVMKIKKTNDSYEVLSYSEAGDGSLWAPSIQKMYPPEIAKKIMNEYSRKIDTYFPNIEMELKTEAEDYFKKFNL